MLFVDRIENGIVVCEDKDGKKIELPRENVLGEIRSGDVLVSVKDKYKKSVRLTESRRAGIKALQQRLIKR